MPFFFLTFCRRIGFLLVLTSLLQALHTSAQTLEPAPGVETIVHEIGKLESVRDPKCYATASRLEDFIYGTRLTEEARFEKIALQKGLIQAAWSDATRAGSTISPDVLRAALQRYVVWNAQPDGSAIIRTSAGTAISITERDRRQYGAIAYAFRAILAVQQDALLDPSAALAPLTAEAVAPMKEAIDLATLAALQVADTTARRADQREITAPVLREAWNQVVRAPRETTLSPKAVTPPQRPSFGTIRAIIAEKIAAYQAYNKLSTPVFLRNLQVYFARHGWPSDPAEAEAFKRQFTETMIAFTHDVLLEAERIAAARDAALIRVEDVHAALQRYEPYEVNRYEDVIYFPRLPREQRVTIEAYDLDAFRDGGLHWLYLHEVLADPDFPGRLEPDPFAAELLVEGVAQFAVLALRIAGNIAAEAGAPSLAVGHLGAALQKIQTLIDAHAKAPAESPAPDRIASASSAQAPQTEGPFFTDVTAETGIDFEHRLSDWLARRIRSFIVKDGNLVRLAVPPAFGGSGVAAEDIDNDGDADILILSGAGNVLYLNDGTGRFTDITEKAGLLWKRPDGTFGEPRQPIIADFDNDGLQDILITYVDDAHRLYRNLGGARFEDVTDRSGLGGKGLVGGPATALDFDQDGLLDLFIGYFGDYLHGELPTLARRNTNALPDKLFRNKGGFVFEDVSAGSGVEDPGWSQAAGHVDFDGDGREDIISGNDFGTNSYFRNAGGGKFEEVSAALGVDKPSYTMNIGITDLNRDGYPDIYISNVVTMDKDQKYILPDEKTRMKFDPKTMANMRVVDSNDLFTSRRHGEDLSGWELSDAVGRGRASTGWSWDADFFDFDNDGDDDLYCVNGMNEYAVYSSVNPYYTDPQGKEREVIFPTAQRERNVFFVNRDGKLAEESKASGADLLGNSRSVAYLDADRDGDLDMIVNAFQGPAVFYRNNAESRGNHWIGIKLQGDPEKCVTRDAIGARILVETASHHNLWRYVFSTIGYLSVHPKEQHLGLGPDTEADVTVIWPNGESESFAGLSADRTWHIVQGKGIVEAEASFGAVDSQ